MAAGNEEGFPEAYLLHCFCHPIHLYTVSEKWIFIFNKFQRRDHNSQKGCGQNLEKY